jgi:hypothetical protein
MAIMTNVLAPTRATISARGAPSNSLDISAQYLPCRGAFEQSLQLRLGCLIYPGRWRRHEPECRLGGDWAPRGREKTRYARFELFMKLGINKDSIWWTYGSR